MKQTKVIIEISLSASIITICSWIAIPTIISFTLQTLAIALILSFLGAKKGTLSILLYLLLGLIGIPVFTGFKGGIRAIIGPTGGYLIGFLLWGALMIFLEKISTKIIIIIINHFLGLILCYILGTIWFSVIMKASILYSITICVAPFVIFDLIKITFGVLIADKIKNIINEKQQVKKY